MEIKSFKEYLSEAKISEKNLQKAINIYVKMMEKHLGVRLYRYGGVKGFVPIGKGVSYLFFASNRSAYAFNYKQGELTSITIWKKFKLYAKGDFTIELGGIGLFQAGKKLLQLLKRPKPGNYLMVPDPTIKEHSEVDHTMLLGEAKMRRVSPVEFLSFMNKNLPAGQDIKRMYWDDISDIAMTYGIQVPTAVRKLGKGGKRGRGGRKPTYDLTQLANPEIVKPTDKAVEPILNIKVTPVDPETKRFMSAAKSKAAQDMYKKIQNVIEKPNVKELSRDVNSLFGVLKRLVKVVIKKRANGLVVYGVGGIGKSYTVETTLKEEGLTNPKDWVMITTGISTVTLYQTFFNNRDGKILVFDDADDFWTNDDAKNMLKAALDTKPVRQVGWNKSTMYNVTNMTPQEREIYNQEVEMKLKAGDDKVKLPSSFAFDSRLIFISNKPRDFFDPPVLTRIKSIDMSLTDDEIFTRIESIVSNLGEPVSVVPVEMKIKILNHLRQKYGTSEILKTINLRVFEDAEQMYLSGDPDWLELVNY